MSRSSSLAAACLSLAAMSHPIDAHAAGAADTSAGTASGGPDIGPLGQDIIVSARRNGVFGDFATEEVLEAADIKALVASDIGELIGRLAPRTGGASGTGAPPVILLNGRRLSDASEISSLPSEAVERMDILGGEVAVRFGYGPDRKVVNVVLRENFRAVTAMTARSMASEGGWAKSQGGLTFLRIAGSSRLSLDASLDDGAILTRSERGIGSLAAASPAGIAPADLDLVGREPEFRSLVPKTRSGALGASYSRPVSGNIILTANGRIKADRSKSLVGIPSGTLAFEQGGPPATTLRRYDGSLAPLEQNTRNFAAHLDAALDGEIGRWSWNYLIRWDFARSRSVTDGDLDLGLIQAGIDANDPDIDPLGPLPAALLRQFAPRTTRLSSETIETVLTGRGPLANLPAGDLWLNVQIAGAAYRIRPRITGDGVMSETRLKRETGSFSSSLQIPIASRKAGVLTGIGDLSASVGIELREVSGFGTLVTSAYGLNWQPVRMLKVEASLLKDRQVPSMTQLGNPVVITPNVLFYDFATGTTADVIFIAGGNPALARQASRNLQLGLTVEPITGKRTLSFGLAYKDSSTRNQIGNLPATTAEFQAAFPERFVRDPQGRLVSFDARPVNFARGSSRLLRAGMQFSLPFNRGPNEQVSPAGRAGRIQGSIGYSRRLRERLLLRDGLAPLDFLNGDANSYPGNLSKDEVQAQLGYYQNGIGAQLGARWQGSSTVRVGGDGTLTFSELVRINASLTVDLQEQKWLSGQSRALKGARISVGIVNLFNARPRVRDENGITPFSYHKAFLDPAGRRFDVSLRKQF